jgi:hypothetical protein
MHPSARKYSTKAINGKNIICQENPTLENNININIIMHEIKKLIKPEVATEIGNISLGKYTFLIILAFVKIL